LKLCGLTRQVYSLPHVTLDAKMNLNCRPALLSMNCASSKLACIDIHGAMSMWGLDMDNDNAVKRSQAEKLEFYSHYYHIWTYNPRFYSLQAEKLEFERKDAWDVCWSDDDDDMFAVLEKAKMYVFRNLNPQEPVTSSGYLCKFSQLQITSIQLDELIKDPENPTKEYLVEHETRSLRDAKAWHTTHAFEPHFNADEPYFDPILTPF